VLLRVAPPVIVVIGVAGKVVPVALIAFV